MSKEDVELRFNKHRTDYYQHASVCSWIEEGPDGTYYEAFTQPCHARLSYSGDSRYSPSKAHKHWTKLHLLLQCLTPEDLPFATRFWEYCVSPDAPWSAINATLVYDKENRPWYITVPIDDKTQAQLMYFFAILTRTPYEHKESMYSFEYFRNNGFDDIEATFLSAHIGMDIEGTRAWSIAYPGSHFAWDYQHGIELKRLREKRMCLRENATVHGTNKCTDCSAIWSTNDYTKKQQYGDYIIKKVKDNPFNFLLTEEVYEGAYPKRFRDTFGVHGNTQKLVFPRAGYLTGLPMLKLLKEKQAEWSK